MTVCLRDKNVEEATKHKQKLEAQQRAEEKDRKEKKLKWQTKVVRLLPVLNQQCM